MITHPFAGFVFKYADKDASECAVLYLRVRSGYWDGAEEAERRLILLQTRRKRLCMRRLYISHWGCWVYSADALALNVSGAHNCSDGFKGDPIRRKCWSQTYFLKKKGLKQNW